MRNILLIHGLIGLMFIVKAETHWGAVEVPSLFGADVIDTHRLGVTRLSHLCRSHRFITVVDARLADLGDGAEILKDVIG